jgi:hypothetical protein
LHDIVVELIPLTQCSEFGSGKVCNGGEVETIDGNRKQVEYTKAKRAKEKNRKRNSA